MGLRDAPLLSSAEVAGLPFPVAPRAQWSHLVRRPLLVGTSLRGFTIVAEGSSDEPTVHTRAIQHFLAPRGKDLERDSWSLRCHVESLCRRRRMALETLTPLTSKFRQFAIEKWVEWGLIWSLGWCAVDASLALSLASRFLGGRSATVLPTDSLRPHTPRGHGLIAPRCLRQLVGSSFPCSPRLDSKRFVPQSGNCPVH